MDVVYLCRRGENEELRYSLRSLKNIPHDRVWIFGGSPAWVSNVTVVNTDQSQVKYANTSSALRQVCETEEVSEDFILMNDDFYIAEPLDEIPVLHRGRVADVLEEYRESYFDGSAYIDIMNSTLRVLEEMGYKDPFSYELHIPMVINKQKMLKVFEIRDAYKCLLQSRTLYGNVNSLGGEEAEDVKVYEIGQRIKRGPFISTLDKTFSFVKPVLDYLFFEKCEYEANEKAVTETVTATKRLYDFDKYGNLFLAYPAGAQVPLNEYERLSGRSLKWA